ncbi:hypothetical protein COR50_20440 [Chitinophaga caeni]|uniref:DUF4412 domain-containing protein n=1 Tax=Chitinophaga caeni TaxID=2029983 RepID=A0A291QZT7_9BACT|nr:hypothetical protein [Chitinophaga caeni]ATL49354.1 hypothetical protein COR50_20440 [Chitinophaga caeni]
MKHLLLVTISCAIIFSCKQAKNKESKSSFSDAAQVTEPAEPAAKETFKEGIIDLDIDFPGNELSSLLKKVDPSKGNIQQQMAALVAKLPSEQQLKMKKLTQSNPFVSMQVLLAPLMKNQIFVARKRVTAKCDGLTYHLENTLDASSNTGKIFVESRNNPANSVTFKYDESFWKENQLQTRFDVESYNRQQTDETATVAGYKCQKVNYTLKKADANPMRIAKIAVWTSGKMPRSLNFIHPYYVEESNGIMKIELYTNQEEGPVLVYEFKTVTSTGVEAEDLEIKQGSPVYNAATELETIGGKLMGIMFGA